MSGQTSFKQFKNTTICYLKIKKKKRYGKVPFALKEKKKKVGML